MEKKDSKDLVNIKLTFLDLFPSFEEIDSNNEGITINFQNFSFSYDLSELIKTRDELLIPNQIPNQSIKVFLLKSGNVYATGPLTIKNGEQWVTFAYENKKRTTNLALSLIDCIKIKFICKMDYVTNDADLENDNNILSNTEIPNKLDNNILLKPSPKKLYNNLTSKKKAGYMSNKAGIVGDPLDSLHTEESKISKIFENISSDYKHSNEKNTNLNNTTLPSNKKQYNNPLIKSENLSEFSPLAASSGVVGKDFKFKDSNKNKCLKKNVNNNFNQKKKTNNRLSNDNINYKDKEIDKQKTNINNSLNNNENAINNNKQNSNMKKIKSKNIIDSKNRPNKKEKHIKSNTNNIVQNANNSNMNQSSKKIRKENSSKNMNSKNDDEFFENNRYNSDNKIQKPNLLSQISNEIKEYSNKNKQENNFYQKDETNTAEIVSNFGLDNFTKKLEDFHLLYNDDYIKNIKEEDYSLEIELYIEKLMELIIEYHLQIEEKEIEYQLIKNIYNKNLHLLSEQNKLSKKLQLIIDDNNIKQKSKTSINTEHEKNKINNIITDRNEVNIFNFIIFSQKDKDNKNKKEKLTKILKNILSKPKHKNIINQNEKIKKWVNSHMEKSETVKEKAKKRISAKQQKYQNDDKDKGKYNKKKKNINNSNNTPPKNKGKIYKK